MKKTFISLVASLALAGSAFAAGDKVYAVVNGENITSKDFNNAVKELNISPNISKEQEKTILDQIVAKKLLLQDVMKSDIVKSDIYKKALEEQKQELAFRISMNEIYKDTKVSIKELKEYYSKNQIMFLTPESKVQASHILLKDKKTAQDIISQLKKSKDIKSSFTKLAKEKSTGPSSTNGGELGWFTSKKMVPEFSQAAFALNKGEFTKEPVQTRFGYHVIYIDDKNANLYPFERVSPQIEYMVKQQLVMKALDKKAKKLKKKAKIQYK